MKKKPIDVLLIGALTAVVVGGAAILWKLQQPTPEVSYANGMPEVASGARDTASSLPDIARESSSAVGPDIQYPVEDIAGEVAPFPKIAEAVSDEERLHAGLLGIIGSKAMQSFVQTEGLIRKIVATVDNLPRAHASIILWPVPPTPGRFVVTAPAGSEESGPIAAENMNRYAPFVRFVETVDVRSVVNLYKRFYPAFQAAYADLGYPKHYFNDRLIQVIDHLLSTPVLEREQAQVQQTVVKGPIAMNQPWAHFVFADPALEGLSAGQKILIRIGPDQAQRLKNKLLAFRKALTRQPLPESASAP